MVAYGTQTAETGIGPVGAFPLLLGIILVTTIFDIIGVSVTSADSAPFFAQASRRQRGARQSLWLLANADRVANVCTDVVGDIAGTVSGALAAGVAVHWTGPEPGPLKVALVVGIVSGFTIGLKAVAKTVAIREANRVIRSTGRVLALVWVPKRGSQGR